MGKGKKKDKKLPLQTEVSESVSKLQISDGASTSQSSEQPVAQTERPVESAAIEGKRKSIEEVKPVEVIDKPTPESKTEETEEFGLGLGVSKKKKPRKKPSSAPGPAKQPVASQAPTGAPGSTSEQGPQTVPQPQPSSDIPTQPPASSWGRPSATASARSLPPTSAHPGFAPPTRAGYPGVTPQPGAAYPGIAPPPGVGYPSATQPPGVGYPGATQPPGVGYPGTTQPPGVGYPGLTSPPGAGYLGATPPPGTGYPGFAPPPSAVPAPGLQPSSIGRGRGRGATPPPGFQAPQPTPGGSSGPPATQQRQQRPGPSGDRPHQPDTTPCRFKIPEKIVQQGHFGRPITVLTNYLPMTFQAKQIHRYDVSFKPDKPKKMLGKAFNIVKNKLFSNSVIAFDQMKNCYALQQLPNVTANERIGDIAEFEDNNGKLMSFEVTFKHTGIVDLGTIKAYMEKKGSSLNPPTEAIQCIDVILRQGTLESYIKAGRQFFRRPANPLNLGHGLEMWTGLFQSAIFTTSAFINIDVAHKGFPKEQSLINAMVNDFRLDVNRPVESQMTRDKEYFYNFIKGLRVIACIGGDVSKKGQRREFICNELVKPPNKMEFTMTDAKGKSSVMTVAEYFAREKKITLRYPNLNCMWVGPRDKKIFYPIELLHVSYGQALNRQLNEFQLSTMVREAATPPDVRKQKIEEVITDMKYSQNQYFKKFGLDIKNEFFPVKAKILQPPKLSVGGGRQVEPSRGAWQAAKLLKPETLDNWGLMALELDYARSNADALIQSIKRVGPTMGMSISEPKHVVDNVRINDLYTKLMEAVEKKTVKFLIIIVPNKVKDAYHQIKQKAERQVGILTQCIKEFTVARKLNDQTVRNILLKVNSKLMGVNQALDGRSMPPCLAGGGCMVVGADVTHPSPEQSSVPSIAAVTASIDKECFRYNIQLSVQTPKKEMIVEFEDMMVEHLKEYRKNQRCLPKKIFVFRDGVSEGQFAQVMNSELQAVHDAYKRLADQNTKPEVLFLLVQKRHHTRLFVPNSKFNVEPGTVVDTDIVHSKELDFYLVSHQAIKGTARPTRYHAVCNDGRIPAHEVEQLTYYLCHLYARCMRAVSYPTPTYYAHLACLRARSLTHGDKFDNADLERNPRRLRVMEKILETSRMFFV